MKYLFSLNVFMVPLASVFFQMQRCVEWTPLFTTDERSKVKKAVVALRDFLRYRENAIEPKERKWFDEFKKDRKLSFLVYYSICHKAARTQKGLRDAVCSLK